MTLSLITTVIVATSLREQSHYIRFRRILSDGTITDSYNNGLRESPAEIGPARRSRAGPISAGILRFKRSSLPDVPPSDKIRMSQG